MKKLKERIKKALIILAIILSLILIIAGCQKAVEILRKRSTDFKKMDVQYLPTSQAKAIAFIAIDYLNEDAEKEMLLNIPLKK